MENHSIQPLTSLTRRLTILSPRWYCFKKVNFSTFQWSPEVNINKHDERTKKSRAKKYLISTIDFYNYHNYKISYLYASFGKPLRERTAEAF